MTEEQMLKLAKEFANSGSVPENFNRPCPRDIKNAGLWFGFVAGYEAGLNAHKEVITENIKKLNEFYQVTETVVDNKAGTADWVIDYITKNQPKDG